MDNTLVNNNTENAFAHKLSEVFTTISFYSLHLSKTKNLHVEKKLGISMAFLFMITLHLVISACVLQYYKKIKKKTQWSLQSHWLDRSVLSDIWLAWQCQSEAYHSDPLPEGARTD